MIAALTLIGAALVSIVSPETVVADRFRTALTTGNLRSFAPLASAPRTLADAEWSSVRNLVERFDCITISSHTIRQGADPNTLLLELDGTGVTRNARRELRTLPSEWVLTLAATGDERRIVSAEDAQTRFARQLGRAETDDRRQALLESSPDLVAGAARILADESLEFDPRVLEGNLNYLANWTARRGDAEATTYAYVALARLASQYERGNATVLASEARRAARQASPDAAAFADLAAAQMESVEPGNQRLALFEATVANADVLDDSSLAFLALQGMFSEQMSVFDVSSMQATTERWLAMARRYGADREMPRARHTQALIAATIGDFPRAMHLARQTIARARELCVSDAEAKAHFFLGKRDKEEALAHYQRALDVAPRNHAELQTFLHSYMGIALAKRGRFAEAEQHLEPALVAGTRARGGRGHALNFAAQLRRDQGRYEEAIEFNSEAIEAFGENNLWVTWSLKNELAKVLIACGDVEAGITALRQSIDLIEARRKTATSNPIIRATNFGTFKYVYDLLLRTLVDRGRFVEALEIAERMRARALADSLAGTAPPSLTPAEVEEERILNQRILQLNRAWVASAGDESRLRQDLAVARANLEEYRFRIAVRYARTGAADAEVEALNLDSFEGATIVEYAVIGKRVVVFVVRGGRVEGRFLQAGTDELQAVSKSLLGKLEARDSTYAGDAKTLHRALLQPIASLLPAGGALTVIPDGFLWAVPFAVLQDEDGRAVLEQRAIVYAPSITMLQLGRRTPAPTARRGLLALADPVIANDTQREAQQRGLTLGALPDAAREVRAVAELYGRADSTVLTRAAARESSFKRLASHYRVIHLATHGFLDRDSPLYSALVFASAPGDREDGLIEMREICDLDLRADLAVLSACDTAKGQFRGGEGVIGIAWAFLAAGCPTTVVSQWKAHSKATSQLMVAFHRELVAGRSPAAALQHAQRELQRSDLYWHPYYWAPFVVIGTNRFESAQGKLAESAAKTGSAGK